MKFINNKLFFYKENKIASSERNSDSFSQIKPNKLCLSQEARLVQKDLRRHHQPIPPSLIIVALL